MIAVFSRCNSQKATENTMGRLTFINGTEKKTRMLSMTPYKVAYSISNENTAYNFRSFLMRPAKFGSIRWLSHWHRPETLSIFIPTDKTLNVLANSNWCPTVDSSFNRYFRYRFLYIGFCLFPTQHKFQFFQKYIVPEWINHKLPCQIHNTHV